MKIKLKKEVLDGGGLCSSSSFQGFPKDIWNKLNNGGTVEVDKIPVRGEGQVETIDSATIKSDKSKGKPKISLNKEIDNGK